MQTRAHLMGLDAPVGEVEATLGRLATVALLKHA